MPLLPWLSALAPLIGSGFNAISQGTANRKNIAAQERINQQNIEFQKATNLQNRQWAIEDFERQNQYNHPSQVMQRLKEAGLNTQLAGGASAISPSASIHTSADAPKSERLPQRIAPQIEVPGNMLNSYMAAQLGPLQIQHQKAQNDLLSDQSALYKLQMAGLVTKNARSEFDLDLAKSLKDTTIQGAINRNTLTLATTDEALARTGKIQTETGLLIPEFKLKQFQAQFTASKSNAERDLVISHLVKSQFENMNLAKDRDYYIQEKEFEKKVREYHDWLMSIGINPNGNDMFSHIAQYVVRLGNTVFPMLNKGKTPPTPNPRRVKPY